MDNFREEIIVKKTGKALQTFLYVLCFAAIGVFGLFGLMGLAQLMSFNFSLPAVIYVLVGFGVAFLMWRYKDNLNTEYEYSFTNGELDFAKVMNLRRRKQLFSLRAADLEAIGEVGDDKYKRYSTMTDVKIHDLTLNPKEKQYFLYYIKEGTRRMVILECSEKMWEMIKNACPRLERW